MLTSTVLEPHTRPGPADYNFSPEYLLAFILNSASLPGLMGFTTTGVVESHTHLCVVVSGSGLPSSGLRPTVWFFFYSEKSELRNNSELTKVDIDRKSSETFLESC
jgi:hypothetical protein